MNNNELSQALLENIKVFYNLLRVVNGEYKKNSNHTLTEKQFFALTSIEKHDKIELKNISKDLSVSTSSMCILLNKLVDQNYVYREEDTKDRRNTFYGITDRGRVILQENKSLFLDILNSKVDKMSDDKKEALFKILNDTKLLIEGII